tara:strand:+ start:118 stop:807 length:690 start_codon:yes stop_codon:yes gene_type:complete
MFIELKTQMNSLFQKEKLEALKVKYKITMDQIIHDTKPKREFKNWKVKISKAINRKQNDPTNFGQLELSAFLTNYFNSKAIENGDPLLPITYFLGKKATIECIGEFQETGDIRLWGKNEKWKIKIDSEWINHKAIYIRSGILNGAIRIIKTIENLSSSANYTFSVAKQKKTNNLYFGVLKPLSSGKYTVEDFSLVSGKKVSEIASNIEINGSAKILATIFPKDTDWVNN